MDILILIIISVILFSIAQFIEKKLKIASPITYLLVGILFGESIGIIHIFGNIELLPNMLNYNTIALWIMFFGAGFNIDVSRLKAGGKDTIMLASIPAIFEGIIMTGIVYLFLQVVPLGVDLNIYELLLIMALFAMASPANVVPSCINYNMKGYAGENRITDSMITASVFDNFTPMPVTLVAIVLVLGPSLGMELTPLIVIGAIVGAIVGMILICGISAYIGTIMAKILAPFSDKVANNPENKQLKIIYTFTYFIILVIALHIIPAIKSLAVLIVIALSMGVNMKEKNQLGKSMGMTLSITFAIFGMPIVFAYVGSLINVDALLNPTMLIFGIIITYIAAMVKGLITAKIVLKDEKYTNGERTFAAIGFLPKGIVLVNFSLILMDMLNSSGLGYLIDFMILLAAISIVASVPLGVTLLGKAGDKWLFKDDN